MLRDFGFHLVKLNQVGIIFAPVGRSLRNGKKTSACLKKVLRNYVLSWHLALRKTKLDFEIQFQWRNKWPQHYITLQMKSRCKKCQILLVSGNQIFRKLSGVFCFYFRKFSPRVYLTKQHNCFANIKSYRTSLLKINGNT